MGGIWNISCDLLAKKPKQPEMLTPERDCLLPTKYRWGPAVKPAPMTGKQGSTEVVQQAQ